MANNIEWHPAKERPHGYTALELAEMSHDGMNDEGYIGIGSGDTMLYGTMHEMLDWFEVAVTEVRRVHGIETGAQEAGGGGQHPQRPES